MRWQHAQRVPALGSLEQHLQVSQRTWMGRGLSSALDHHLRHSPQDTLVRDGLMRRRTDALLPCPAKEATLVDELQALQRCRTLKRVESASRAWLHCRGRYWGMMPGKAESISHLKHNAMVQLTNLTCCTPGKLVAMQGGWRTCRDEHPRANKLSCHVPSSALVQRTPDSHEPRSRQGRLGNLGRCRLSITCICAAPDFTLARPEGTGPVAARYGGGSAATVPASRTSNTATLLLLTLDVTLRWRSAMWLHCLCVRQQSAAMILDGAEPIHPKAQVQVDCFSCRFKPVIGVATSRVFWSGCWVSWASTTCQSGVSAIGAKSGRSPSAVTACDCMLAGGD